MRQLHAKPRGLPRRSFAVIAATLNTEGHATRRGGPWKPESVRKILKRTPRLLVIEGEAAGEAGQPRRVVVLNPLPHPPVPPAEPAEPWRRESVSVGRATVENPSRLTLVAAATTLSNDNAPASGWGVV